MVDSGLDETSCFFADDDGLEIEHDYLFEDYSIFFDSGNDSTLVSANDEMKEFKYDLSRRKVMRL